MQGNSEREPNLLHSGNSGGFCSRVDKPDRCALRQVSLQQCERSATSWSARVPTRLYLLVGQL